MYPDFPDRSKLDTDSRTCAVLRPSGPINELVHSALVHSYSNRSNHNIHQDVKGTVEGGMLAGG